MKEQAAAHDGFAVVKCLSECFQFHPGSFASAVKRKGGSFEPVPETHDVTDEEAAYALTKTEFPGYFGVFYQTERITLNQTEAAIQSNRTDTADPASEAERLNQSFLSLA